MEPALKDLLDSYRTGLKTYFDSLPEDNKEVLSAKKLLSEMESLAESSADYSAFMAEAQNRNYFTEIIGYYSKLGNEVYQSKPKSNRIPSPQEIAKGYHLSFESFGEAKKDPNVAKIYNRVFQLENESTSGPNFIFRMEEEDLFLRMSKHHMVYVMRDGLEKLLNSGNPEIATAEKSLGIVSSPQMEHYFESMQIKMNEAKTIIEMEVLACEAAENSRFSNLWDSGFLFAVFQSFLSPLISFRMTGSKEHKEDTKQAYEFVCDFYGTNWNEIFENPRIWDYFERTIFGGGKEIFKEQGITSAKELKNHLRGYLEQCVQDIDLATDLSKQIVWFRDSEIELSQVYESLKKA
ncbi:hypothetical protein [Leptospira paudalimensis]|uniref:Uncharacterized protein n=1 Tax=Leptospira paudalimensis TaxID=2950024 RepID=A0ABT3M8I5_9LEPT|nr:hypothetical protein [Leptospira paudalimensis]MCW7504700.1 hypothetical protein [Leptospira paudalimensis]